jgi:hypothetical protein
MMVIGPDGKGSAGAAWLNVAVAAAASGANSSVRRVGIIISRSLWRLR